MLHHEPPQPGPKPQPVAKPDPDEVTRLLKQAAKRRRPWTWGSALLTALFLGLPAALLAWWLWPRPEVPELVVVAFDQLTLADQPLQVRAATEPRDGDVSDLRWGRRQLHFMEVQPNRAPGKSDKQQTVQTDAAGFAAVAWTFPATTAAFEIEISYVDDTRKPPWFDKARGRVFAWQSPQKVLIVDLDPTLKNAGGAAAKGLRDAAAKGWKIVYLAVQCDRPLEYHKLREWILGQMRMEEEPLPNGPILTRTTFFSGADEAAARKEVLSALQRDFGASLVYVKVEMGLKVHSVGSGGVLVGDEIAAADWAELASKLP